VSPVKVGQVWTSRESGDRFELTVVDAPHVRLRNTRTGRSHWVRTENLDRKYEAADSRMLREFVAAWHTRPPDEWVVPR